MGFKHALHAHAHAQATNCYQINAPTSLKVLSYNSGLFMLAICRWECVRG